jgi:hypothetical protein
MKLKVLSGLSLLVVSLGSALAGDATPINRVIASVEIETDDPVGYAHWISEGNKVAKEKLGIDKYQQVLQAVYEGEKGSKRLWVVRSAESVAQLTKNSAALANDPARLKLYDHFNQIRKTHGNVLYQALRYERSVPNGHALITRMNVTDEAAYVAAAQELRALYDRAGFKDVTMSIYRVIAGRTDYSHLTALTAPSAERLAELLDAAQRDPGVRGWLANAGKFRSVVSNATHKNITP